MRLNYLPTLLVALFLISPLYIFAQDLKPSETKPLYDHLFEINNQWQHYKATTIELQKTYSFKNDQQRIQKHLQVTTNILRATNTQHLNDIQLSKRTQLLNVLEQYWKAGSFPINDKHTQRQPYFVDTKKTSCAVAYLMQSDGQSDLVQKINAENNYAYIDELINYYPNISTWASKNGFTTKELALIQPGYYPPPQSWYAVGNDGGIEGRINVMKTSYDGNLLYMAGQFTAVDNVAANNIIAWDGEEWSILAQGVDGEIIDMDVDQSGNLYIVGDFVLNQSTTPVNIASWDGTEWTALQEGNMNGSVTTILVSNNELVVGGDFQNIDGDSISYLAKKTLDQQDNWNNNTSIIDGGTIYDIENAFAVNEPVTHLVKMETGILIGGQFTQTAPQVTSTLVQQLNTQLIAYWNNNNWETAYTGPYIDVGGLGYANETIVVGNSMGGDSCLNVYANDAWTSRALVQIDPSAKIFHGFTELNSRYYSYGNFGPGGIPTIFYQNVFAPVVWGGLPGSAFSTRLNATVRASDVFQDHIYFAGDFTWAGNESNPYNGLVQSPFANTTNSTFEESDSNVNIYCNNKQLHIKYEDLSEQSELQLYDTKGQPIKSIRLNAGAADLQKNLSNFANGVYFYQLTSGQTIASGKLAVF